MYSEHQFRIKSIHRLALCNVIDQLCRQRTGARCESINASAANSVSARRVVLSGFSHAEKGANLFIYLLHVRTHDVHTHNMLVVALWLGTFHQHQMNGSIPVRRCRPKHGDFRRCKNCQAHRFACHHITSTREIATEHVHAA
eukprot:COSAG01_NODE_7570_length_3144_cov_2.131691_2_plen_142_part_00